jgi:hypothetical protein
MSILSVQNTMERVKKTRRNTMAQLLDENAARGVKVQGLTKDPCQETWVEGLRHYVNGWWRTPDGWKFVTRFFPVFVKRNPNSRKSFNCDVKNEGGQYVLATLPARDKLDVYLKSIPIYKDLSELEDGVYTWIFYTRAASPVQFAATKTWSALEMGTTHLAIASRVGASKVHGGGEVRKSGATYTYNLLSGTFTGEWKKKAKGVCTGAGLEAYIDNEFKTRFASFALRKTDTTLITQDLPVTEEEIETYTKAGWTFQFFTTQKECLDVMKTNGGRRRTRRAGARKETMSEAQQMLRRKQIQGVQEARTAEINDVARLITRSGRDRRPHWVGPSEAKQERLSDLLYRDDRLRSKGKGRTRRN